MRYTFGKLINTLAAKDKRIYLLVGDIGFRVFDDYRRNYISTQKLFNSSDEDVNFIFFSLNNYNH